jgi:HAD superfamily hydrolase (TIGR01509 family)
MVKCTIAPRGNSRIMSKGMVIFDLDGTLTVPVLDFDAIRAELGLGPGPVLESLARLDDDARRAAEVVLRRHESAAALGSVLQPGAAETIRELRARGWPVAILTRNTQEWTEVVLAKHGVTVDGLCTRDDGVVKPSPEPVLRLCERAGRDPRASWMVGDHLFDILSGRSAGARTVLLLGPATMEEWEAEADHTIASLPELLVLVQ